MVGLNPLPLRLNWLMNLTKSVIDPTKTVERQAVSSAAVHQSIDGEKRLEMDRNGQRGIRMTGPEIVITKREKGRRFGVEISSCRSGNIERNMPSSTRSCLFWGCMHCCPKCLFRVTVFVRKRPLVTVSVAVQTFFLRSERCCLHVD